MFDLSTSDILSVKLREQPDNLVEYKLYMREHGHVFHNTPVEGEVWISAAWDSYHAWEDGRSNYAWDLGALNSNMLSYNHYGTQNNDFEVFGKTVILPMDGKVVTVISQVSSLHFSIQTSLLIFYRRLIILLILMPLWKWKIIALGQR